MMKISRIGLLLALPAWIAGGLQPSVAEAGKLARAAAQAKAVLPGSVKPTAPAAAPSTGTASAGTASTGTASTGTASTGTASTAAASGETSSKPSTAAPTNEPLTLPAVAPQTGVAPPSLAPRDAAAPAFPPAAVPESLAHKPALAPAAAGSNPQRLSPKTNSDGVAPMLVAPSATMRQPAVAPPTATTPTATTPTATTPTTTTPAATPSRTSDRSADDAPKTYRNVLREGPAGEPSAAEFPALRKGDAAASTAPTADDAAPKAAAKSSAPQPAAAADAKPAPRVAAKSLPARSPVIVSDDAEPGAPAGERKSTIGREPADARSRQLFETEQEPDALTPELVALRARVQKALAFYYQNWTLNTRDHSPWEVMHAIIAYGVDTRLHKGGPGGETTTAIGHLCFSGICANKPILTIRDDKLYALRGPGVQGHSGQFLAILAQSFLQRDYPLFVDGRRYTLEDLIAAEQEDCESGTELTFKLIALMHYLPSDATWKNFQGQTWSLDRLVREEIVQPIRGAACGGTHRLMGLSYAVRKREQRGEPITGIYEEARRYIDQYHKYTFSLQNRDGSFSTAWFVRPEARNDVDRRMQTTGHILEWLCFSLTDEQLRDPRVVRAVGYVTDLLLNERISQWEVGHLGHALHALQIYNERVFGGPVRSFEALVTRRPLNTVRKPTPSAGGAATRVR